MLCCLCSGVDVYTAVAGAVGALYGPLHGGANEAVLRMLERIGSVENIPAFIAGQLFISSTYSSNIIKQQQYKAILLCD